MRESIFRGSGLDIKAINKSHHTDMISLTELIVRRGQPFEICLSLRHPFDPELQPLIFCAKTVRCPSEEKGTASTFSIQDSVKPSQFAKAVWKVGLHKDCSQPDIHLKLDITPPADAPIGKYTLTVSLGNEKMLLANLVILFNPWCPDDSVYLEKPEERDEYVLNDTGIIYAGSNDNICKKFWDFGQFEDGMVQICLKILDCSLQHRKDPSEDAGSRSDPGYVGRVVSAMVNNNDDSGVIVGNWNGNYCGGRSPTSWDGSYRILRQWFNTYCTPVKYGQCWVYAGVMCSVMRLLGIPTRVVTNFQSAHDTDGNLTIDTYHYKGRRIPTKDSIWNFHVWVESFMKRPDLGEEGRYDGWQALDATPQEKSKGVFCCGPASVKAIQAKRTDLKYDMPFVYAEVNADVVDWLIIGDKKVRMHTDKEKVGKKISTKAVGSRERLDITHNYKPAITGAVATSATLRSRSGDAINVRTGSSNVMMITESAEMMKDIKIEKAEEAGKDEKTEENVVAGKMDGSRTVELPPVSMQFSMVKEPINGEDVTLNLVLQCSVVRQVTIDISVYARRYNGSASLDIQGEETETTLNPGKALSIPIVIPFSAYCKHMLQHDSMSIEAIVEDKENPDDVYLAEYSIVLLEPTITITVLNKAKMNETATGEFVFMNPINTSLTKCSLTLSGSGLLRDELEIKLPDLKKNCRIRATFSFVPYKCGQKTIVASFNCSSFRDIKSNCMLQVEP
ncbi:protein-glutamine gamma-glutamyltransferase E-like isoform X2 [Plectropomus leopardus]|uniref:protein-glutamine gamma-glutamyltransferase E-like isoform X2 n=1 Tax=Plectropomus leopardus TaxID=160734 RepID=UPI001C4C027C|nr:protein-glutamine gamma-glutamyltransferase E-like isoform X2 [Plectropomus leopardus]